MNNASLELGGDNWAAKDGNLLGYAVGDSSGKYVPNEFTFTRGSNLSATRVNADGYIEKGYENTLLGSNDWAQSDSQYEITGGEAGYDGTNDAWLVNKLAAAYFGKGGVSISSVATISIYAKAGSLDKLLVFFAGESARFDLTNVTAVKSGGGTIGQSIELVSGTTDWYRCSLAINVTSSGNLLIKPLNSSNQDVTGTMYIQDAMINQGLAAYPYIETTTAPVAGGILEDMPRLDYSNGSCPALLLEPSRTNLATQSEYLEGNRKSGSISFSYNDSTSPEGITNAALVSVTGSNDRVQPRFTAINGLVCISIFLKHNGTDFTTQINAYNDGDTSLYGATARVTSSEVTFSSYQSGYDSADFVDYGNGWFRVYVVCQSTTGYTSAQWRPSVGLAISYPCYGFQVEQGSYPTSYIPTYGVSQTRLAESMVSDTSSFGITDEFTFFIDTNGALVSGTSLNTLDDLRWYTQSTNKYRFYKNSDAIFLGNSIQVNDRTKIALKITATQCKTFVDGVLHSTISLTTPFASFDTIFRGTETKVKDELNQITLFPTALTDSECIELTTI